MASYRLPIALLLLTVAAVPARALYAQGRPEPSAPPRPTAAAPGQPGTVTVVREMDARETRNELRQLMERHPPGLGRVLKTDPTLLQNPAYLARYPQLAAFLNEHPEVAHNPSYYLSFIWLPDEEERLDARGQAMNMWRNTMEAIGVFFIFLTVTLVLAWLVRTVLDHRRWLRVSRVQNEVHNKLLDRFSGTGELLSYVQTSAGRKFLESAPIPLDPSPRGFGAPFGRILWSVQAGVVLLAAGLGFQYATGLVIPEVAQGLTLFGVLGIALGLGFLASGLIAYLLSRRLGLLDPVTLPTSPERSDSPPV